MFVVNRLSLLFTGALEADSSRLRYFRRCLVYLTNARPDATSSPPPENPGGPVVALAYQ